MTEWIILICTMTNPLSGFSGGVVEARIGKRIPQVFITSTTADFTAKWETLSGDDKKTAQVYVGKKSIASVVLTPQPNLDERCKGENDEGKCVLANGHGGQPNSHSNPL